MTFRNKVALGFAATIVLGALTGAIALYALRLVVKAGNIVALDYSQEVIEAQSTHIAGEAMIASSRGFLLTGKSAALTKMKERRSEFFAELSRLHRLVRTDEGKRLAHEIEQLAGDYVIAIDSLLKQRSNRRLPLPAILESFESELQPKREQLDSAIKRFVNHKQRLLDVARITSQEASSRALFMVIIVSLSAIALAITLALLLTRTLTRLYRDAQDAIRLREDVLAIVSHDLQNPIGAMILNIELLSRFIEQTSNRQNFEKPLSLLRHSVHHMTRLIVNLLDISRLEAGQLPIEKGEHFPRALVKKVLLDLEPLAKDKSLRITTAFRDQNSKILCDSERIGQALSNLIGNAIKFTPAGGLITIETTLKDDKVRFTISDTGPGIPEDQLRNIFDRYKQARAQDHKRGSGLGLFIAKGIVEAHGGTISVKSILNQGSVFEFSLPTNRQGG